MSNLKKRLNQLQKKVRPPKKIIILWPGDPYPAEADLKNAVILRVVYGDRQANG